MDDVAAELREPRYQPRGGFRIWAGQVDGAVEVYADTGVTAEQLTNALALYVRGSARLVEVEAPGCADGANLFRFRLPSELHQKGGDSTTSPNVCES